MYPLAIRPQSLPTPDRTKHSYPACRYINSPPQGKETQRNRRATATTTYIYRHPQEDIPDHIKDVKTDKMSFDLPTIDELKRGAESGQRITPEDVSVISQAESELTGSGPVAGGPAG